MAKVGGIGLAGKLNPSKHPSVERAANTSRPGNIQPVGKSASVPKPGTDEHFRATSDMETLRNAEQIKMDPKRHGVAKAIAAQHIQALQNVTGQATGPRGPEAKVKK